MMELSEALVETITRRVLAALIVQAPALDKPAALLLDAEGWEDLEGRYTLEGMEDYERKGSLCSYELVLLDHVAPTLLADLALGRGSCAAARAVSEALLAGKTVYLAEEGLLHRAQYTGANPGYYAMLEDYAARLVSFGVRLGKRSALTRLLTRAEEPPAQSTTAPKLLTADAARSLCRDCGGVLRLAPGTVITPLARDVLQAQKIRLEVDEIC